MGKLGAMYPIVTSPTPHLCIRPEPVRSEFLELPVGMHISDVCYSENTHRLHRNQTSDVVNNKYGPDANTAVESQLLVPRRMRFSLLLERTHWPSALPF